MPDSSEESPMETLRQRPLARFFIRRHPLPGGRTALMLAGFLVASLSLAGSAARAPASASSAPSGSSTNATQMYVGSPVPISGSEDVGSCTIHNKGRETEVSLASDPNDPNNLVAAWMQRVVRSGDSTIDHTNVVGWSADGGLHWSRTGVPGMSRCTGTVEHPGGDGAVDPSVAIGADGVTYLSSIGVFNSTCPGGMLCHDVQANYSMDHGRNWSDVVTVDDHNISGPGNDFPSVVAHPNLAEEPDASIVFERVGIYMSQTTDGGVTWMPKPNSVPIAGVGGQQLLVLPDDSMVLIFIDPTGFEEATPETVFTTRSTDGGSTWSVPAPLARLDGFTFPRAAYDPRNGTVYVTWWNGGKVEIVRSVGTSSDGNLTWSTPTPVSDASRASRGPGPVVAVDPFGTVGVLWYDSRNDPDPATAPGPTDVWFAHSSDGGLSWSRSADDGHVAGPFDLDALAAAFAGRFKLGEYISLVPLTNGGFGAAFVLGLSAPNNVTDVFYSHIRYAAADLSVTKTDSPDPVNAGQNLTYHVTVTNNGPDRAVGVTLNDPLPAGVSFVSVTPGSPTCSGTTTISCALGELASGASTSVDIVVKPTQPGALSNTATVSSGTVDPNFDNNTATATTTVVAADLSIAMTDSPYDPAHVGQPLTYTITVTNLGPQTATGVSVRDTLPKSTGFGSASASCTRSKTIVVCSLGTLAPGQTATVTIVVKPTQKGTITNTATVSATSPADPNLDNNTATEKTTVQP
jgi:uncharacterized repeat protein (TIGR01451 family)